MSLALLEEISLASRIYKYGLGDILARNPLLKKVDLCYRGYDEEWTTKYGDEAVAILIPSHTTNFTHQNAKSVCFQFAAPSCLLELTLLDLNLASMDKLPASL